MKEIDETISVDILNCTRGASGMGAEVLAGLAANRKSLPSKYFYDARGSALFEKISLLPEYYQTRTEMTILTEYAGQIMEDFEEGNLVEFGSGANWKIRKLLDCAEEENLGKIRYVAVDVSGSALRAAMEELAVSYPDLKVLGVVADFVRDLGDVPLDGRKNIFVLFGSTIGNLSEEESRGFLSNVAALMGPGDRFLLGVDMVKDRQFLEEAYNDSKGVTAEFNKNILAVLNRELNADFDPDDFEHIAFYDAAKERVEMHLAARRDLSVSVGDLDLVVSMKKGEAILTEVSRKFTRRSVEEMVNGGGLKIKRWFSDPKEWFSLVELTKPHHGDTEARRKKEENA